MYIIVIVSVAPSNWIKDKGLLWPNVKGNKLLSFIRRREQPQENHWQLYDEIKILCKGIGMVLKIKTFFLFIIAIFYSPFFR